jgi:hypothetical protein
VLGTLAFGVMSDQLVKGLIGLIAVGFTLDRLLRHRGQATTEQRPPRIFGWLSGVGAGFTSTLAHAGGLVMIYLLSWRQPRETFVATTVFSFRHQPGETAVLHRLSLFSIDTLTMSAILLPWYQWRVDRHASFTAHPGTSVLSVRNRSAQAFGVKLLWDGLMA